MYCNQPGMTMKLMNDVRGLLVRWARLANDAVAVDTRRT